MLQIVPNIRDLGVIVSNDLSTTTHVTDVVSKAHRCAKLILRTFISQDVNSLVRAFIIYVRPLLEYNTVIRSPHTARDLMPLSVSSVDSLSVCEVIINIHTVNDCPA